MHNLKIFSYGTLQRSKFTKGKVLQKASLNGPYEIMEDPAPLLVELNKGNHTINGVLFEVTQDEIDEIDDYESLPHLFKREEKNILLEDGSTQKAWVYLLNHIA